MTKRLNAISRQVPLRAAAGIVSFLAIASGAASANAADPKLLGNHKDWAAYSYEEGGKKVCYMSSTPKSSEPKGAKRSPIYTLVTHRPAENSVNVFSVTMGYPLRKGGEVSVEIDKKSFALFTDGETGWARDADADKALAQALRGGSKMTIKGVSQRGTTTTDTYSLSGVAEALNAISDACGVKH